MWLKAQVSASLRSVIYPLRQQWCWIAPTPFHLLVLCERQNETSLLSSFVGQRMTSNAPRENGTSRVRVNTKTQSCESLIAIIQKCFDATNVKVKHNEVLAKFIAKVGSDSNVYRVPNLHDEY